MEIKFHCDTAHIAHGIELLAGDPSFLKRNKILFNFPFSGGESRSTLRARVERDLVTLDAEGVLKIIEREWLKRKNRFRHNISQYARINQLNIEKVYDCYITLYGPKGFFERPVNVFVNINIGPSNSFIKTVLHEIIHLVLGPSTDNLPPTLREKKVDSVYRSLAYRR